LAIFQRNFEAASSSRDAAATSRFFKLFPTIGWEAEGLLAYANFVVDLIHVRPPASAKSTNIRYGIPCHSLIRHLASSPLYYITALTSIFESIAMIVDQHQPVVERYYGAGKMNSVIKRLLDECDKTVIKLVEGWEEERAMKRKVIFSSYLSPNIYLRIIISLVGRCFERNLVSYSNVDEEAGTSYGRGRC
jgi:conserved oligomeric Golgi complex subunit 4